MSTSTILSDNGVSSGTSGIKTSGGNDGTLVLQTTTAGGAATTALTIDTSQNTTLAGTLTHPLGSAGSPSITFTGDTNTGLYSSGADTVVVVTGGTAAQTIDSGQRTKFPTTIGVGGATPSTSGSGISFPATQSASTDANTLDDYEEGTWSLTMVASGATFTNVDTTCRYIKIGRSVTVYGYIQKYVSSGGGANAVTITGLPFTSQSGITVAGGQGIVANYVANSNGFSLAFRLLANTTTVDYMKYINDTGITKVDTVKSTDITSNNHSIQFSFCYLAES